MDAVKNFRRHVSQILKERGVLQLELAEKAGINRVNLNRILMGKAVPGLDTCAAIAKSLNVSLEALISEQSEILV